MTVAGATELIGEDYDMYGVRVDPIRYAVGDTLPDSRVWEDGEPTEEVLEGTSCIEIRKGNLEEAIRWARSYGGGIRYLVAGNAWTYGEDAHEVLIRDARVLCLVP